MEPGLSYEFLLRQAYERLDAEGQTPTNVLFKEMYAINMVLSELVRRMERLEQDAIREGLELMLSGGIREAGMQKGAQKIRALHEQSQLLLGITDRAIDESRRNRLNEQYGLPE